MDSSAEVEALSLILNSSCFLTIHSQLHTFTSSPSHTEYMAHDIRKLISVPTFFSTTLFFSLGSLSWGVDGVSGLL